MEESVIIYTNLFTIKNKDIKQNKYIDMYYIWLYYIIKYAQLKNKDYCISFIDKETYEYIQNNIVIAYLRNFIPNLIFIEYERPSTIKEGILKRYDIELILENTKYVSTNSYYIHLDIDVLIMNNIRNLFRYLIPSNETSTLFLKCEGKIIDNNYYGELITEDDKKILIEKKLDNMPGFSAGIYAWRNSKTIRSFFNYILENAEKIERELYTVEQPFFNAAAFYYLFYKTGIFKIVLFDNNHISHNIIISDKNNDKVLVNFCGKPGDDSFHFDKILLQLFTQGLLS